MVADIVLSLTPLVLRAGILLLFGVVVILGREFAVSGLRSIAAAEG